MLAKIYSGGDLKMLALNMMRYGTEEAQRNIDGRWRHPMMNGFGGNDFFVWVHLALGVITWILVMAVLVSLIRLLWAKGERERKNR